MENRLRLGILGCARILENAIINPCRRISSIEIFAIASRTYDHAVSCASQFSIPHPFESYEKLLDSPLVDFVYIALPNHLHLEWAKKTAKAKKHLLVEKPLCTTIADIAELKAVCEENGTHVLEGLMVYHHPWQEYVRSYIENGLAGKCTEITTHISFTPRYDISQNYRSDPAKGGGSFFDLAPYWLQFLQSINKTAMNDFDGRSLFNGPNNCDMTFDAEIIYSDGMKATLVTSFEQPYKATHILTFERTVMTIQDMFRPNTGRFKFPITITDRSTGKSETVTFPQLNYYENQLLFFADVINGKRANIPLGNSIERIELMEKIYHRAQENYHKEKEINAI